MRHYETIYIVNPNLADEECRDLIDKFNKLIEENKGIIITIQEWGKRSLAYLIKKYDNLTALFSPIPGSLEKIFINSSNPIIMIIQELLN